MTWQLVVAAVLVAAHPLEALLAQEAAPAPRRPDQLAWRTIARGVAIATVDGDPEVAGQPYTLMIRLADDAWIAPHWHEGAKRLLVLEGTLLVGHGPRVVPSEAEELETGSFLLVPPAHVHYEGGRGAALFALYGIGPLKTTFVPRDP